MPIIKSAKKKLRQDVKRRAQNLKVLHALKQAIKSTRQKSTADAVKKAFSAINTAEKKHVIHKNKANRLKSQIAKLTK